MKRFVFYDRSTSECVGDVECEKLGALPDGWGAVESDLPWEGHYFDGEVVVPCGDYTLDALPVPCRLRIDGLEYEVSEPLGEIEFPRLSYPVQYQVSVDAGPRHLKKGWVLYVPEYSAHYTVATPEAS